jgi:predicted ATP-grasp superfamily ATP-dependent carboligase
VLVEINPRLTTSYVGYRKLSQINLAQRMLTGVSGMGSSLADVPLTWRPGHVKFNAAGEFRYSPE